MRHKEKEAYRRLLRPALNPMEGPEFWGAGGRVENSLWLNALSSRFRNSRQLDKEWRFKVLA